MNNKTLRSCTTALTQGTEIEAVLDDGTGKLYSLTDQHFRLIAKLTHTPQTKNTFHTSSLDGKTYIVGTKYYLGEQSLDASRALPEMNINPIGVKKTESLKQLSSRQLKSLKILNRAVKSKNKQAGTISLSMHPLAKRDKKTYRQVVTPKAVYKLLWDWKWDHTAGIITAHTSPWTSINIFQAADALSVMLGSSAASIAIFGNSPLVEGKLTGLKENRQTMWSRLLGNSTRPGDFKLAQMPKFKPRTLAQYFNWMFGPDTQMPFTITGKDYKTARIMIVPEYPSMLKYLTQSQWAAFEFGNKRKKEKLTPKLSHLFASQWMQFIDARWRYTLKNPDSISISNFIAAVKKPNKKNLEKLLAPHLTMSCIESRPMGTALPCPDEPYDNPTITPNALQLGLLRNLDKSAKFIDKHKWADLRGLREASIKHGLQANYRGLNARKFAQKIVSLALEGLKKSERWALKRAVDIVQSGQSAADKAIATYQKARAKGRTNYQASMEVIKTRQFPQI